jgi:hypothetical protein
MADNDDQPTIAGISPRALRIAAASADMDTRTALRALAGFPVRNHGRERLLRALSAIGADTSSVPEPYRNGKAGADDDSTHVGPR